MARNEERGLVEIGSLIPKIMPSVDRSNWTPPASTPSSSITGQRSQVPAASSSIGPLLTEIAAANSPVAKALAKRDAEAVYVAMAALLKQGLRSWIEFDLDSEYEWTDCKVSARTPPDVRAALVELAERLTTPGGEDGAVKAIMECLTKTRSRPHDELDIEAMIGLFCRDLAEFPADIVATACNQHARVEKWWPSFSEILERCHRAYRWRRSLKAALG